ncbi:MAG TPA: ABC transporter substrate-binding protein [Haliangiales bacterium]|nr:ABC transporter substrate-binding protein [Haliangiales bacterium]
MHSRRARGLIAAGVLLVAAGAARADELKIGMSGALTGPAQALGQGMKAGIEAYFARVNAAGGVAGHMLRLVALDDGYEPARAGANVRKLIEVERVFAILGNPGTPTAAVAVPIAVEHKVPFFGAFTGAGLLRKTPPDRYVINFRASYAQETGEMVRGLTKDLGIRPEDIAFMTQNDAYGDAGYAGGIAALKAMGYADAERLPHARYPRNTVDVEGADAKLLDPAVHPRAIIMIGAYKPCAKFIRLARRHGLRALFVNVSFVIGDSLKKELGADAEGVIVTQVVPPVDSDFPAVREYRESMDPTQVGFVSLEGYLAARAFIEGLRRAGPGADAERFIDALETAGPLDLGLGPDLEITKARHQLSNRVWPTIIGRDGFRTLAGWADARRYLEGGR